MICQHLSTITGIHCMPLDEGGTLAAVFLPLEFADGNGMHIYCEHLGQQIRFFDDGEVLEHFASRGVDLSGRRLQFLRNAASPSGVVVTKDNMLEVYAPADSAGQAFAAFLSALVRIRDWETQNEGSEDESLELVAEIETLLREINPHAAITHDIELVGYTGQVYTAPLAIDGQPIMAVRAHHNAISSAIKRLLDIRTNPSQQTQVTVVLDDRQASSAAKADAQLLQTVSTVQKLSSLQERAVMRKASAQIH